MVYADLPHKHILLLGRREVRVGDSWYEDVLGSRRGILVRRGLRLPAADHPTHRSVLT